MNGARSRLVTAPVPARARGSNCARLGSSLPSAFRKLRDAKDATGFDRGLWQQMAEMGFAGVLIPEAHGGSGLGYVAAGLIQEAAGRNLALSPLLSTAILAASALVAAGSEEQRAKYLPQISSGERLFALAADEKPRHAPHHVATRAEPSGNGFKLNGDEDLRPRRPCRRYVHRRGPNRRRRTPTAAGITLFLVDAKAAERRHASHRDGRQPQRGRR